METVLGGNDSVTGGVLYLALELSDKRWKLGFSEGSRVRVVSIAAGDWAGLHAQMDKARAKFKLAAGVRVVSCYEAGRDGFWIHRDLVHEGVDNVVVDPASIEVNRHRRRAKTDRLDVRALLRQLMRYAGGEGEALHVVRVPSVAEEDRRRLHRERERLIKERGAHASRIDSLLITHGVRLRLNQHFAEALQTARGGAYGYALGEDLLAELGREYERYRLADDQIKGLEAEQRRRVQALVAGECADADLAAVAQLMQLKAVGWQSAWLLVQEFFGWRRFANAKQVGACAGLTPTPYDSGDSRREQGVSKAGNRRVRTLMVELAWLWLRYQPDSALSRWFRARVGGAGKRARRIAIVALARKLLVALWRYLEHGVMPAGAVLKPSVALA